MSNTKHALSIPEHLTATEDLAFAERAYEMATHKLALATAKVREKQAELGVLEEDRARASRTVAHWVVVIARLHKAAPAPQRDQHH